MSMESAINLNLMDLKQKVEEQNELLRAIKTILEENSNREDEKKSKSTGKHFHQ